MALATVDQYGAPAYGVLGYDPAKTRRGVVAGKIFHTPENATIFLSSAIALARWQASPSNTSGGSYHGILACRDGADPALESSWVMVRSVPWDQIAGGVSTRRDAVWAPDRHPWIKAGASAAAYADPNAYFHQIALSGRTSWYATNGFPAGMLATLARWIKLLEGAYRYDSLLTEHTYWQTNRSDVTGKLALAVLAVYQEQNAAPAPPSEEEQLRQQVAALQSQVTTLNGRITTIKGHVKAGQTDLTKAAAA